MTDDDFVEFFRPARQPNDPAEVRGVGHEYSTRSRRWAEARAAAESVAAASAAAMVTGAPPRASVRGRGFDLFPRRPMRLRSETRARRLAERLLRSDSEEEEYGSGGEADDEAMSGRRDSESSACPDAHRVDLAQLPTRALREYMRRFHLANRPCANKMQLLHVVSKHLHAMRVDETSVVQAFAARALSSRTCAASPRTLPPLPACRSLVLPPSPTSPLSPQPANCRTAAPPSPASVENSGASVTEQGGDSCNTSRCTRSV